MKLQIITSSLVLSLFAVPAPAADSFDNAMGRAMLEYGERLRQASAELTATRAKIAQEKAPLLKAQRTAEDRIIAADGEITRLETAQEQSTDRRRRLIKEAESLHKNDSYANTLAQESLKAFEDGIAPGEGPIVGESLGALQRRLENPGKFTDGNPAMDAADFLLGRVRLAAGGYTAEGSSLVGEGSQAVKGTFAFVGPESYFLADQGGAAGRVVRLREGSVFPVTYLLTDWNAESAGALFQGKPGTILADASGGKALRLKETKGSLWQHISKGGLVAYAIVGVGCLSLLLILQKTHDLSLMGMDSPEAVRDFLLAVSGGVPAEIQAALGSLKATTRELFATGLRQMDKPKVALEEHLCALLLRQRLHYERRLPLLAVIATAAPLMGLLGTVIGMVKTFALITVFGTGNAGKLASGISEVLVATELGLLVAIPTLVAHGFLAHRIQKNLSLLERYAQEFVTAAKSDKAGVSAKEAIPT